MHILFVCTGNICRSPTAERLAIAMAAERGIPDVTASSAGTRAVIGHPMHPDAARVLQDLNGDPTGFVARQLTPKVALSADLVLTMTLEHLDVVLEMAPRLLHRTFTLTEAARAAAEFGARDVTSLSALRPRLRTGGDIDIPDPIGKDPGYFSSVGSTIANSLLAALDLCRPGLTDRR